jgi:transposase
LRLVKAQKNDDRDAEGIAEAASRPTMRFVELKSQKQLDIQTLHRVRSRLVTERTNLINRLRAILPEREVIFPAGRRKLELGVDGLLATGDETLSARMRQLVGELRAEWQTLDTKIEALNREFVELARNNAAMRRRTSIPGVEGLLNATALVAAVGDGNSFTRARDLGAWLAIVPRQHTTGGKARLLGISKRGNTYLRTLLVHGARAAFAVPIAERHATWILTQGNARTRGELFRAHAFEFACAENYIGHRLTKPRHPWTNGQVERMNRTIKEATVKRFHYGSHDQLRGHLQTFVSAYNFGRRLKTLRSLTPYEFICKAWTNGSQPIHAESAPLNAGTKQLDQRSASVPLGPYPDQDRPQRCREAPASAPPSAWVRRQGALLVVAMPPSRAGLGGPCPLAAPHPAAEPRQRSWRAPVAAGSALCIIAFGRKPPEICLIVAFASNLNTDAHPILLRGQSPRRRIKSHLRRLGNPPKSQRLRHLV